MEKLDLQRFAEGEGPVGGGGDVTGGAAGTGGQAAEQAQQQLSPFQALIQGEGKAEFEAAVGQRVQSAIQKRFRNQQDTQRQLEAYAPIMQRLAATYGVDPGDVDGIYKRMTDDLSLYQKEADERGTTPEMMRDLHRMEERAQRAEAQNKQYSEREAIQEHWGKLAREAEEMRKTFPDFDLMRELENERFARMTAPGVGISVQDAYYAIHGQEIQRQSMQYAAQQAGQRIAASVQAGASRPVENGMQRQNPVAMGVDIRGMDKKTRAEYARRIKAGETINFRDKI